MFELCIPLGFPLLLPSVHSLLHPAKRNLPPPPPPPLAGGREGGENDWHHLPPPSTLGPRPCFIPFRPPPPPVSIPPAPPVPHFPPSLAAKKINYVNGLFLSFRLDFSLSLPPVYEYEKDLRRPKPWRRERYSFLSPSQRYQLRKGRRVLGWVGRRRNFYCRVLLGAHTFVTPRPFPQGLRAPLNPSFAQTVAATPMKKKTLRQRAGFLVGGERFLPLRKKVDEGEKERKREGWNMAGNRSSGSRFGAKEELTGGQRRRGEGRTKRGRDGKKYFLLLLFPPFRALSKVEF